MRKTGRVTVADIAKETGVSLSTVSLALRGKGNIPAETRQRVQEIARAWANVKQPVPHQGQRCRRWIDKKMVTTQRVGRSSRS